MLTLKKQAQDWLHRFGLRVERVSAANRFNAMAETLCQLRAAGYAPRLVIDGGANAGQWARLAMPIFPTARFHLVEPQPACAAELRKLTGASGGVSYYPTALTSPGIHEVRMIGGGPGGGGTGAWVGGPDDRGDDEIVCPATTLDALFADVVAQQDRALLKLDLEGHELPALEGASRLLSAVEVVVSEVRFYAFGGDFGPVFRDCTEFLHARGFVLYDFASLSSRERDGRLRLGDAVFVRHDSALHQDAAWA